MMPLRYQILGHLLVGLLVGYLLNLAMTPPVPEIERKSEPFVTQRDMLAVTVTLHRSAAPEITDVQLLEQGRVSIMQPGDYALVLLDADGEALYTNSFRATFLRPGEPPRLADEIRRIFVVPYAQEVVRIVVAGPQGSDEYELSK